MDQVAYETTRDTVSNSGSLDHDDDSLDSEKALNLAMAEEAYHNNNGSSYSMNGPNTSFGNLSRGLLAPQMKDSHSALGGSLSPPRNSAAPISTSTTSISSATMSNSAAAAALAAVTASSANASLPLNPLAQVKSNCTKTHHNTLMITMSIS